MRRQSSEIHPELRFHHIHDAVEVVAAGDVHSAAVQVGEQEVAVFRARREGEIVVEVEVGVGVWLKPHHKTFVSLFVGDVVTLA